MKTQFRPVPPFRAYNLVAAANRYFQKFDEARALAEAIVETIREPLLVLDEELRVVTANRSFRPMFKVDRWEVQGRPFYALGGGR